MVNMNSWHKYGDTVQWCLLTSIFCHSSVTLVGNVPWYMVLVEPLDAFGDIRPHVSLVDYGNHRTGSQFKQLNDPSDDCLPHIVATSCRFRSHTHMIYILFSSKLSSPKRIEILSIFYRKKKTHLIGQFVPEIFWAGH